MVSFKRAANIFGDKALLAMLASDQNVQFSKEHFQIVMDVLAKATFPRSLDCGILRKIFECLRSWSSAEEVSSVVPLLANVYDNLLHGDLGQPNVSNCLCELLFLIEDMSDHQDCKRAAGEHFLQRLLALAESKLTTIKLQRVAVETLSSILLMCPQNQKIVLEDLYPEWHRLVKHVLPHCGDFFVQASIVEIFYRLSKRSPRLFELLGDKKLREKMVSLHQTKNPDLHAETRTFLDHLNHSLGGLRSVYSFLAKDIILDGQKTPLKDEKWVHFGLDHMSCYAALDSNSAGSNISLVDVIYSQVCDLQVCSKNSLEIIFRDLLPSEQDMWIRSKTIKLSIFLKSKEIESIMDYVLPRIIQKDSQKEGVKEFDSEKATTPSFSADLERSFRKASVGFAIPLPKKFKLPSLPKNFNAQADFNKKTCEDLQEQTQDETECKTGCNDNGPVDHGVAACTKSSTRVFHPADIINQENTNLPACQSQEHEQSFKKNKDPGLKGDGLPHIGVNNCKNLSPDQNSTPAVEIMGNNLSSLNRKDAVSNLCTNAGASTMKVGHVNNVPRRSSRRTGTASAMGRGADLCRLRSKAASTEDNDAEPMLQPGNVGQATNDDEGFVGKASVQDERNAIENLVQWDPASDCRQLNTKEAVVCDNDKVADSKQSDSLQKRILNILKKANLPESDADDMANQKHSTSDPIETDSEQKKSVPCNRSLAKTISSKASKKEKEAGDTFLNREAGTIPRCSKRKRVLQLEKAGNTLPKKQASQKDVFCFEEDEQCTVAKDIEGKLFEVSKSKSKNEDHPAGLIHLGTAAKSTRLPEATTTKLLESGNRKNNDDNHLADLVQTESAIRSTRLQEATPTKLFKVGISKSRNDNCVPDFVKMDTPAKASVLPEKTSNRLFKVAKSKSKDDHLADLVHTDTATNVTRSFQNATANNVINVANGNSKKTNYFSEDVQTITGANSAIVLETFKAKLSKAGNNESKDADNHVDVTSTSAHSTRSLETTPHRVCRISNNNNEHDEHLTHAMQTKSVAHSTKLLERTSEGLFRVGKYERKGDHLVGIRETDAAVFPLRLQEKMPFEPLKVSDGKSKVGDLLADIVQKDSVANSARLAISPSNSAGFDNAFINKSVCHMREEKREPDADGSPAKRIKHSPEVPIVKSLNDGLQCSHFARQVLASFNRIDSPKSCTKFKSKDDRMFPAIHSSPQETRKEQVDGIAGGKQKLAAGPKSASPARQALQTLETRKKTNARDQKHNGKIKKSFDVLLKENVQPAESNDGDAMADGEMQLVAALVQKIMKKIKIKTQNKSAQILSNATEAVQQCCQEVQGQIQSDLDESTKLSQETFGQLQLQLQEEKEAFLETQKKWRDEFNKHIHRFKAIASQIDSSHSYLKSVSDKQKAEHGIIFSNLNEFVESHLIETEKKLVALQKGAAGHRNELKGALLQIF